MPQLTHVLVGEPDSTSPGHALVPEENSMPDAPERLVKGKQRPFTGAEYLESLRDGREVYIYGERVKDVTAHPALRNAAVSVAKLYDALHDEKSKDELTTAHDTDSGRYP